MVSSKQLAEGLICFAESELLPALDGWRLWTAAAALALVGQRVEAVLSLLADNKIVSALGIIDKDNKIDLDAAVDALKLTARKHGKLSLDVPVLDISFSFAEKDIETLRGYIEKAQGGN